MRWVVYVTYSLPDVATIVRGALPAASGSRASYSNGTWMLLCSMMCLTPLLLEVYSIVLLCTAPYRTAPYCTAVPAQLYEASRAAPDLLLDAATLTGTARVALGPDMPAAFTNDDATWGELAGAAAQEGEPLWRLPLYAPYKKVRALDSSIIAAS